MNCWDFANAHPIWMAVYILLAAAGLAVFSKCLGSGLLYLNSNDTETTNNIENHPVEKRRA